MSSVPSAPLDVVQAPGTAGIVGGMVIINWTAPSNDGGSEILSYIVYQTVNGTRSRVTNLPTLTVTTATLIQLTDGSSYTFEVAAVNENGVSPPSIPSASIIPYQQVQLYFSNDTQTYTGSPLTVSVVSDPSGAPITVTYSGNHTDAGTYDVSAVVTGNAFYSPPISSTFLIMPATATIDVSNLTQAWTGSPLQPSIITTPVGLTTTITYGGGHTDPGNWQFIVDISENNYVGTVTDNLIITFSSSAIAAGLAATTAAIQAPQAIGAVPQADALIYAATASSFMQSIANGDPTQVSTAASAIIGAIQTEVSTLAARLLTVCAAINATKTNSNDANAATNASQLVTALQGAYSSGSSAVISGANVATLMANVTTSGTLPTSVALVVANSTNVIDIRDVTGASYTPMVPGVAHTILTSGSTVANVVYSASNQSISVDDTVYVVGDTVTLGSQDFRLFAIGSIGLTPIVSSVPCFPKGTLILTPTGYKTVETLQQKEHVLTADGRQVPIKLYGERFEVASERSAPYFIPKGSLGLNRPSHDLTLSPDHAFQLRKGVWMLPRTAAKLSKKVQQIGVGEAVHYYHVECPNYLKDNLVTNGCTVESYAGKQLDFASPYTWSASLKGYTRRGEAATKSKATHAHA